MKNVIVITLILFSLHLSADIVNWSELSFRSFITTNNEDMPLVIGISPDTNDMINNKAKYGINWKHELRVDLNKNLNLLIDNNLFYSDKSQENINAYFVNYSKMRLLYTGKMQSLTLQFRNRLFQQDNTRWLTISGTEQTTRQNMVNIAELNYKKYTHKFVFNIYTQMRNLNYSYFDGNINDTNSENDFITHIQIHYHLNQKLTLFTTAYYKDDLNKESQFNHTQIGTGIEYLNRYDFFNIVRTKFTYLNNISNRIDDEKEHYFIYNLRYTKRIGMNFAGFTSYESRFSYDVDLKKFLRISNQLRVQGKYSYLNDKIHDSFVLGGFKLNPENNASSLFGEINQNIWDSFYISVFSRFAFKRYINISEKAEYFFSMDKSIWIKHEYNHIRKNSGNHLFFVGSTLFF